MKYIQCKPTISPTGQVKHPKKQEYLNVINQAASLTNQGYFGIYFSGSTNKHTGDWAVMGDFGDAVDFISLNDVY